MCCARCPLSSWFFANLLVFFHPPPNAWRGCAVRHPLPVRVAQVDLAPPSTAMATRTRGGGGGCRLYISQALLGPAACQTAKLVIRRIATQMTEGRVGLPVSHDFSRLTLGGGAQFGTPSPFVLPKSTRRCRPPQRRHEQGEGDGGRGRVASHVCVALNPRSQGDKVTR